MRDKEKIINYHNITTQFMFYIYVKRTSLCRATKLLAISLPVQH